MVWASAAAADAPLVSDTVDLGTADDPWSVYAADVDGDGDLDVLSASMSDDEINWYENDGASPPSFTPRNVSSSVIGASGVFAADVDGDGDMDVLSSSLDGDTVAWHENDGASPPAFSAHLIDTQVDAARTLVAADLDRDGDADVVSASELGSDIAWYESDGASPPVFTKHLVVSGVSGATCVAVADVNGDGRMDVISSSEHDDILAWHENDGASPPNFTRYVIFDRAQTALWQTPADIDGDGDIDVALASIVDRSIRWLENDGASPPGWTEHLVSNDEWGARSVFAGDLDGDGDVDLLSAAEFDDKVSWHENDGASPPGFTTHQIENTAMGASSVFAGDVDGDGDVDALSVSFDDDHVRWFDSQSIHWTASFEAATTVDPTGAAAVHGADVDGDGDADLLLASPGDGSVVWLVNDGASPPVFARSIAATGLPGVSSVSAADLDGDGDLDAVAASRGLGEVLWLESDGAASPGFTTRSVGTFGAVTEIAVVDLDRDGDLDVVGASSWGSPVVWWSNDGQAPAGFDLAGLVAFGSDGAADLFATDLDEDGDPDLLAASPLNGVVLYYENDGATLPAFDRHVVSGSTPEASAVRAGDMDGDGDLDVVSASALNHQIAWHESNGASPPGFTTHVISSAAPGANDVRVADVDRDGDLDVVATAAGLGQLTWYESNGASPPGFVEHAIATGCTLPSLELSDLDGDGRIDAVCASLNGPIDWHRLSAAQASLVPASVVGPHVTQGSTEPVLELTATHLGRPGDGDVEIGALGLRFEVESGVAMTTPELNALVSTMWIVRDDGSGEYEPGIDTVALEFGGPITLVGGVPDVGLPDGAAAVAVAPGEVGTFFIALEFKPFAASEAVTRFSLNHAPLQGTSVVHRGFGIPLEIAEGQAGGSGVFEVVESLPACSDGTDNDLDTFTDFPDDPQCASATWDDEAAGPQPPPKPRCGLGPELAFLLPALLRVRRSLRGRRS